jgi:site-specific recombinase XerD
MLEDMQLRGLSARTQGAYLLAVRQLAEHFHRSPDQITEEELRQYFLYLANEKRVARATATIALCGIRFFFTHTLQQEWTTLQFIRPRRERKLPVVLSREEVRRALQALREPAYRACLTTIYAGGLRLLEGARLQVAQVDSARMQLLIHGKGGKDRYVPLAPPTLALLRAHWRTVWMDVSGIAGDGDWREKASVIAQRIREVGLARVLYGSVSANGGGLSPQADPFTD